MFLGLTNLVELDLSSNLLTSVPTPTFSGDFKEYFHLHAKNKNCEVFFGDNFRLCKPYKYISLGSSLKSEFR